MSRPISSASTASSRPADPVAVRRLNPMLTGTLLVIAVVLVAGWGAMVGQNQVGPAQVFGSLMHHWHLPLGPMPNLVGEQTLWNVRFPRVALALLVGAALGTAGALLQGVFANPLAEPGVIGVSSGSAVGAASVIAILGLGANNLAVASGAFIAGLATATVVYLLSRDNGRTDVLSLVLTGIAVNAVAGGLIAYLVYRADPTARDQIVFWQMGSLNQATWTAVQIVAAITVAGMLGAILLARRVDLLALGESAAGHLGVNVERTRTYSLILVALLAAGAVSFAGIILFVGLVIPHLVRLLVGPAHRALIPLSALTGAVLLEVADIGARTLVPYADLPIGMLTTLIGGPAFLVLLRRHRRSGWAS